MLPYIAALKDQQKLLKLQADSQAGWHVYDALSAETCPLSNSEIQLCRSAKMSLHLCNSDMIL